MYLTMWPSVVFNHALAGLDMASSRFAHNLYRWAIDAEMGQTPPPRTRGIGRMVGRG